MFQPTLGERTLFSPSLALSNDTRDSVQKASTGGRQFQKYGDIGRGARSKKESPALPSKSTLVCK
jgi:hypothetical protein